MDERSARRSASASVHGRRSQSRVPSPPGMKTSRHRDTAAHGGRRRASVAAHAGVDSVHKWCALMPVHPPLFLSTRGRQHVVVDRQTHCSAVRFLRAFDRSPEPQGDLAERAENLHVLHVLPFLIPTEPGVVWATVDDAHRIQHALENLRESVASLKLGNLELEVRLGDPGQIACDRARNWPPSLSSSARTVAQA